MYVCSRNKTICHDRRLCYIDRVYINSVSTFYFFAISAYDVDVNVQICNLYVKIHIKSDICFIVNVPFSFYRIT